MRNMTNISTIHIKYIHVPVYHYKRFSIDIQTNCMNMRIYKCKYIYTYKSTQNKRDVIQDRRLITRTLQVLIKNRKSILPITEQ